MIIWYNYNTQQLQTVTTDYSSTGLLSKMPSDLRSNIINTTVVSGLSSYGSNSTTKITTTDKIYLLAPHEIWEDVDGNPNGGPDFYDNAYNDTRQTDYYQSIGITSSSYSGAIKKYSNGTAAVWWLRNAIAPNTEIFALVWSNGNLSNVATSTNSEYGVSPAFRIG